MIKLETAQRIANIVTVAVEDNAVSAEALNYILQLRRAIADEIIDTSHSVDDMEVFNALLR